MAVLDRLPAAVWPEETNVGGVHRTARYVGGPILLALGLASLLGWLPTVTGTTALVLGLVALFAGAVSLVEAHSQKCPGYAAMGIDTCRLPEGGEAPPAEEVA